jgi:hypothetical protein
MQVLSIRVDDETKEQIEAYQQGDEKRSATARRLLRWGLDEASPATKRRPVRLAAAFAGLAYIAGYAVIGTAAGSIVGGAFIAAMLVWASWPTISDTLDR